MSDALTVKKRATRKKSPYHFIETYRSLCFLRVYMDAPPSQVMTAPVV